MIHPLIVAFFSLTTAIGLVREATKKKTWYMRLRWFLMAWPFVWCAVAYYESWDQNASFEQISPWIRGGVLAITFLATLYFGADAIEDFRNWRDKK